MPAAAADADAARQQRASKLASAGPEPQPEPEPEPGVAGGAQPSVEAQRAAELKDSVYWRHRGAHHIKPPADAAAVEAALNEAAACIAAADGLLFITGAGMGVDMGLQDFRSSNQFWQELGHPEIQRYEDSSDNKWFEIDPQLAWGINYSQLSAYREAKVHAGYDALLKLAATKGDDGHFCWTSNIDGVLQRAGFAASRVYECHGNIHRLQCTKGKACKHPATGAQGKPWDEKVTLKFDEKTCRAEEPLPTCHVCGALARPNLWFCTDSAYQAHEPSVDVSDAYQAWIERFVSSEKKKLAVIECGAGLVIPSCRIEAEDRATDSRGVLIRVNPGDYMVPPPPAGSTGVAWYEDPAADVGTGLHRATSRSGQEVDVPSKSIAVPMGSAAALSAILERVLRLGKG